jgi:hypothetical protein
MQTAPPRERHLVCVKRGPFAPEWCRNPDSEPRMTSQATVV